MATPEANILGSEGLEISPRPKLLVRPPRWLKLRVYDPKIKTMQVAVIVLLINHNPRSSDERMTTGSCIFRTRKT